MLSQSFFFFFFSGTESKTSRPVQAAVVRPSSEPFSASVSAPVSPSKPEEEQSPVDPSDITLSLSQTNSEPEKPETEEKAEDAEAEVREEMVVSEMEYEKKEEPEGHFEEETNRPGTEECEREQMLDRDVEENVVLSEKERQNEELNEKDNCSASSISSASSTLEREEREEKHISDSESGENNTYTNQILCNTKGPIFGTGSKINILPDKYFFTIMKLYIFINYIYTKLTIFILSYQPFGIFTHIGLQNKIK